MTSVSVETYQGKLEDFYFSYDDGDYLDTASASITPLEETFKTLVSEDTVILDELNNTIDQYNNVTIETSWKNSVNELAEQIQNYLTGTKDEAQLDSIKTAADTLYKKYAEDITSEYTNIVSQIKDYEDYCEGYAIETGVISEFAATPEDCLNEYDSMIQGLLDDLTAETAEEVKKLQAEYDSQYTNLKKYFDSLKDFELLEDDYNVVKGKVTDLQNQYKNLEAAINQYKEQYAEWNLTLNDDYLVEAQGMLQEIEDYFAKLTIKEIEEPASAETPKSEEVIQEILDNIFEKTENEEPIAEEKTQTDDKPHSTGMIYPGLLETFEVSAAALLSMLGMKKRKNK